MKLDGILMREAFATEDWDAAVRILQSVFGFDSGSYSLTVHKDVDHYPEIVAYTATTEYGWSVYGGFRQYPLRGTTKAPVSVAIFANLEPQKT